MFQIHNSKDEIGKELYMVEVAGSRTLHIFKTWKQADACVVDILLKPDDSHKITALQKIDEFHFSLFNEPNMLFITHWETELTNGERVGLVTESQEGNINKCWIKGQEPYIF